MPQPSVVVITGPCSVGKTATAVALQEVLEDPWLFLEVDRHSPVFPSKWGWEPPAGVTTRHVDHALRAGFMRAVRGYVDEGFRVIAEIGVAGQRDQEGLIGGLFPAGTVRLAVLVASRDTVLARARQRGDRDVAWALAHYDRVDWRAIPCDVQLDTEGRSPEDVATELHASLVDL